MAESSNGQFVQASIPKFDGHYDHCAKLMETKNYLYQAIDRDILETILNTNTAKQIWDSMKQKFQGSTLDQSQGDNISTLCSGVLGETRCCCPNLGPDV